VNFKRQAREDISVNMTPLIDIVFLLLIFFMVSTTFTQENHLSIDLPEASADAAETPVEAIDVVISAAAEYSINGQVLLNSKPETIRRGLAKALGERQSAPLIITADAKAPHETVVFAMDAAGQLGLINISITTRQPAE
jgi:biopolymer transport protein ExbD